MNLAFRTAPVSGALDLRLVRQRDRAALRILDRAEAATPRQLAILVYGHRRVAQRRLAALWRAGLLERTILPPAPRGGAEIAYRLSREARHRLGDRSPRVRGSNRLGHTLDVVETICALVTASEDPRLRSPVALWLTEATARTYLGGPPFPDSIVVLQDQGHCAVVCLEIDEATQRRGPIEAKLNGYRRLLTSEPGWQVLFIVPSPTRARWLRVVAGSVTKDVASRTWVTTLAALRARHLEAGIISLDASGHRTTVAGLLTPVTSRDGSSRDGSADVGSNAWIQLLGQGGVEDVESTLAGAPTT